MKKIQEISDPNSCLNRASPDEFLFVLRSKDKAMADTIVFWAGLRIGMGLNKLWDPKIQEALALAEKLKE